METSSSDIWGGHGSGLWLQVQAAVLDTLAAHGVDGPLAEARMFQSEGGDRSPLF